MVMTCIESWGMVWKMGMYSVWLGCVYVEVCKTGTGWKEPFHEGCMYVNGLMLPLTM